MKIKLTFLLLSLCQQLIAQEYPLVQKVEIKDKTFTGSIDYKYPISIYLKFSEYANNHMGAYALKGWYYYDKVKVKIPLVGFYNHNGITLYQFNDTNKAKEVVYFETVKNNHWEEMKYYENLSGFQEKFNLSDTGNYWSNNKKQLKVYLNTNELDIKKTHELLWLSEKQVFDLHDFGTWNWNFKLIKHVNKKYLLEYNHGSSLNIMGRCGAGQEKGLLLLEFNDNGSLIQYEFFETISCLNSVGIEKTETSDTALIYHCNNYDTDESFTIKVDFNSLTVERE